MQITGKTILTLLGFILTMANIVGEQKLRNWEKNLRQIIDRFGGAKFRAILMEKARESPDDNPFLIFLVFLVIISVTCSTAVPLAIAFAGFILFGLVYIGLIDLIMYVLFILPLKIVLLPYILLDNFVEKRKLQSTFIVIGIIMTVASIMFAD